MRPRLQCVVTERSSPAPAQAQLDLDELSNSLFADPEGCYSAGTEPVSAPSGRSPSAIAAMQVHYRTNFTVKGLMGIAHYYGLHVNRMRKDALVREIVAFESNEGNAATTQRRRRCWAALAVLGNDVFFKQALIGGCQRREAGRGRVQLSVAECTVV